MTDFLVLVGSLLMMLAVTLLLAWKCEAWIRRTRNPYAVYGVVGKTLVVGGIVTASMYLLPQSDIGARLMFMIAGQFVFGIGLWLLVFRYVRFPERRWENNVIKPPGPPQT